jgi:cellulose synthase/poly-beta-1,6-N-acetylglucosamine synthase-like glycosyltransferase
MRRISSWRNVQKGFLILGIEIIIMYVLYWMIDFMVSKSIEIAFVVSAIGSIIAMIITGLVTYSILHVQKWTQWFYRKGKKL